MPPDVDRLLANARWVKALAVRLVGDDAAADDLTQETLLRALERPPRDASTPRSLRAWLKQVVARFALQRRRHDDAALARERAVAPSEVQPDVSDVVAHAELHRRIVDAVLELDEPYRATILLRFFEDEAPRRIAERMAVPLQTVHTRLRRGIDRLRARFDVERRSGGELHSWVVTALPPSLAPTIVGRLAREVVVMSGRTRAVIAASIVAGVSLVVWRAWPRAERRAASDVPTAVATPVAPATDESPGVAASGANRSAESIAGGRERSLSEINEIVFSGSIAVTGRVVDSSAAPIAGAELELSLPGVSSHTGGVEDAVDEEIRAHGFWDAPCAPPRSKTRSDASGRFTLGGLRTGLPYTLTIAATGFRTESRRVPDGSWGWPTCLGAADAVRLPDVVLTRGCDLTVHVVDAGGSDAGGAAIYSDRWPGSFNHLWTGAHSRRGTTNSRGLLTLPPPRSDAIWIVARAPDGREANVVAIPAVPAISADGKVPPIELVLADGEELDVRVLDGDGHPLAGLRVTVRSPVGTTGTLVDREAETDDEGRVHFRGLPPGEREVGAAAPGGMPELEVGSTRLSKIAAGTKEVELRLRLAHPPIPVRFVDASDGSPVRSTALLVVDAEVDGPESGRNRGRDVPTRGVASIAADATRGFILLSPACSHPTGEDRFPREMQSDRFRVVVDARDHARTWLGPFDPKKLSTREPLMLAIERGHFVSGSVVDGHGSPIPGARIHEIGPGPGRACNMFTWQVPAAIRAARAETNGAFTLGPLADGPHALVVDATGFIATTAHVAVSADSPAPIRVVLGRGTTVEGEVRIEPDEEPTSFLVVLDRRSAPVPDLGTLTAAPDEAGHFEFSSVPPGDYSILALLPPASSDENFRTANRLLGREETPVAPQVVRFSLSDEKKTLALDPWREERTKQRLDTSVIDPARPGANEAVLLYLDKSGLPHSETIALSGGRLAAELRGAKSILVLFSELVPAADLNGRAGTRSWYVGNAVLSAEDLERGVAPIKIRRGTLRLHVSPANGAAIDEGATLILGFFVDPGFSRSFPELLTGNTRTMALSGAGIVTLSDLPAGRTWLYAQDDAGNGHGEVYVNVVENQTTDVELPWK